MSAPATTQDPLPGRLYALVFLSGASSLIFEIVWIRALGRAFGTSTPAIATVVGAFMLGLALGSVAFGRLADRHAQPLQLYSQLELGIALSALAISALLLRGEGALLLLARAAGAAGPLAVVVRAAAVFALLLVPTTLMGGTLPVLARALVRSRASGEVMGLLYGANTAGAVLGALLPDTFAVPALGFLQTTLLAAGADLAVSMAARRLAVLAPPLPVEPAPAGENDRRALLLFGASGFCALGYELAWSRALEHLAGGWVIAFSILLAVYLAALALGSHLAGPLADRTERPLAWAAFTLAASAFLTLGSVATLHLWRSWLPADELLPRSTIHWTWEAALLQSLLLEGPPALMMGAGFPFLAAAALRAGRVGEATGRLYATNTVAGVLGSVLTGFALLPALGLQRTLVLLCALGVAAAVVGGWAPGAGRQAPVRATLALAVGVALIALGMPAGRLSATLFQASEPPLRIEEGTTTSVAVFPRRTPFGAPLYRVLETPGVQMSDTSFGARRYQGLMAHLPLLFAGAGPQPREVLLICFGVGNTARSILAHPEVSRLDVVDISPEVLRASPQFAEVTGPDPLRDPRTQAHVEDGRFFLATTDRKYDVITAEPPPPYDAGVVNLYSREYYAAARRALRPGGVLAQWMPLFQLTPGESRSIVATAAAEFPYVAMFYGHAEQWILLGSDRPLAIDLPAWRQGLAQPAIEEDLKRCGIRGVDDVVATYLQTNAGLRRGTASSPVITDDRPLLQYPSEDVQPVPALAPELVGTPDELATEVPVLRQSPGARRMVRDIVDTLQLGYRDDGERDLVLGNLLRPALAQAPGHPELLDLLGVGDDSVQVARASLEHQPKLEGAAWVLGARAFFENDWAGAEARLASFQPSEIDPGRYWLFRGGCQRALGRDAEAAASFQRAADAAPNTQLGAHAHRLARAVARGTPWSAELGPLALPSRR